MLIGGFIMTVLGTVVAGLVMDLLKKGGFWPLRSFSK
jgi:hypothetical protein